MHMTSYFLGALGRVILFLYQNDIIYYNENFTSKMPILLASLLRMFYFVGTASFLQAVIAERICASCFVTDYEKKSRHWVSYVVIFLSTIVSLFFAVTFMLRLYTIVTAIIMSTVSVILSAAASVFVYLRSCQQLGKLQKEDSSRNSVKYTLSTKYQLRENVRVMKMVLISFLIMCLLMLLCITLFGLTFIKYCKNTAKAQLCLASIDLLVAISTAVISAIFATFLGEWKRVIRELPLIQQVCQCWIPGNRPQKVRNAEEIGQQYFQQLEKTWS
ncbi:hypothetical protein Y032_0068g191 [Ancylostoma ceylanicum]|nr:hypothetical protein Y032_0068g191 [Ancylostoma ceylanicum]